MTVLLRWLIDNVWVLYIACAIGAFVYLVRALAAQRERALAMFTLEREGATARAIQNWTAFVVFLALGVLIFVSSQYIFPDLTFFALPEEEATATPMVPLVPPTITAQPSATPSRTLAPLEVTEEPSIAATEAVLVPTEATTLTAGVETPLPEATPTTSEPAGASGTLGVTFGNVAELVSFSIGATEVVAGQPLELALTWRALDGAGQQGYQVFTHLISPDGLLIAQHDGAPAGGARPVDTWTPGETIVDPHSLAFQNPGYAGQATLYVGLYDPAQGRLPASSGGDAVALPVPINVRQP